MDIIKLKETAQVLAEIQHHYEDKDKEFGRAIERAKDALRIKFDDEMARIQKFNKKPKKSNKVDKLKNGENKNISNAGQCPCRG